MRIYINSKEAKMFVPIPNCVLYSKLGAYVAANVMQQNTDEKIPIDYKTLRAMQKALKQCIRTHGHFTLVDVESADGDKVKIVL